MISKTKVETQKIDSTILETQEIVISTFSMFNKDGRERFFEKSFLLANIKSDIILEILFLTMSNTVIDFQVWDQQ